MHPRSETEVSPIKPDENGEAALEVLETASHHLRRVIMSIGAIILIVVILMLIGALPTWPYSQSWGYAPGGLLGAVVVVLLLLLLMGRI